MKTKLQVQIWSSSCSVIFKQSCNFFLSPAWFLSVPINLITTDPLYNTNLLHNYSTTSASTTLPSPITITSSSTQLFHHKSLLPHHTRQYYESPNPLFTKRKTQITVPSFHPNHSFIFTLQFRHFRKEKSRTSSAQTSPIRTTQPTPSLPTSPQTQITSELPSVSTINHHIHQLTKTRRPKSFTQLRHSSSRSQYQSSIDLPTKFRTPTLQITHIEPQLRLNSNIKFTPAHIKIEMLAKIDTQKLKSVVRIRIL